MNPDAAFSLSHPCAHVGLRRAVNGEAGAFGEPATQALV